MFQALEPLIRSAGKLVLSLAMEGDNVVVFLTPQGGKDATLRQPLILKASAAELDEGFATAIASYSTAHKSLEEQVEATNAILEAQKSAHVSKAQKALTKGAKPTTASTPESDEGDGDSDGDETGDAAATDQSDAAGTAAPAAEQKPAGTDLSSLLL